MPKCDRCGGEIIFRYVGGACTPIHLSGHCADSYSNPDDGWVRVGKTQPLGTSSTNPNMERRYTFDSYTNPHAKCPVCGDKVFFYQSPDGGRVFFDELGPPWPKHPCTDNAEVSSKVKITTSKPSKEPANKQKTYNWDIAGWSPFRVIETNKIHNTSLIEIQGIYRDKELVLYLRDSDEFSKTSPVHIKSNSNGTYEFSTIIPTRSGKHVIQVKNYTAYVIAPTVIATYLHSKKFRGRQPDADKKNPRAPKKHNQRNQTSNKTAMEIAFEKGHRK